MPVGLRIICPQESRQRTNPHPQDLIPQDFPQRHAIVTAEMADTTQTFSSLPQGFSVYQPALGAPLQFFPALGSQELDDMINAYIPGPSATNEKRATITLDFFHYAQRTGQTFKFYPVQPAPSPVTSPSTTSPSSASVSPSFNVSPITSSWDWSATSASSVASSPHPSVRRRRGGKQSSSLPSRSHATDFSHLPGMKILTKDGVDVTHSGSRGTKTKEQRDHAHLMRIIKACDSCRRKKIRCDPSHKKRGAAQAAPQKTPKPAKRPRVAPSQLPPPCPRLDLAEAELPVSTSTFEWDPSTSLAGLDDLDAAIMHYDSFDELIQFPQLVPSDAYFFPDASDYTSSQSTPSSATSPTKSRTPTSQQGLAAPSGPEFVIPQLQEQDWLADLPFLERARSASDYTDFNLYSPASSFSEDERMLSIVSSVNSLPNLEKPSLVECSPVFNATSNGEALGLDDPGLSRSELQVKSTVESMGDSCRSKLRRSDILTTMNASDGSNEGSRSSILQATTTSPPGTGVPASDSSPCSQTLGAATLPSPSHKAAQGPTPQRTSTSISPPAASVSLNTQPSVSMHVLVNPHIGMLSSSFPGSISGAQLAESARQSASGTTIQVRSELPATTCDKDNVVASQPDSLSSGPSMPSTQNSRARQVLSNGSSESASEGNSAPDRLPRGERCHNMQDESPKGLIDVFARGFIPSSLDDHRHEQHQPQRPGSGPTVFVGSSAPGASPINEHGLDRHDLLAACPIPSSSSFADATSSSVDVTTPASGRGVHLERQRLGAPVFQSGGVPNPQMASLISSGAGEDTPTTGSHNRPALASGRALRIAAAGDQPSSPLASVVMDSSPALMEPRLLQTVASMSSLILCVFATAMAFASSKTIARKSAMPQAKKQTQARASCRELWHLSSLGQRTMFTPMAPVCAV